MPGISIKEKLIQQINQIEDDEFLENVLAWLEAEASKGDNGVYHLSPKEIEMLDEAQKSVAEGRILTQEEANRQIEAWLGK